MGYRHITSCIALGQQQSKFERMVAHGVPVGLIGTVLGAFAGGGLGAIAGFGGTLGLSAVLGFCDWWFHYRLICIQDDQCAVGTVGRTAVSTGYTDPDLDFTINLVLAPVNRTSFKDAAKQLPLLQPSGQARYYTQQAGYPELKGMNDLSTEEEGSDQQKTTALHCEIEGNGMETVCTAATVAGVLGAVAGTAAGIAAGAAAAAGCVMFGFLAPACWLVAAVLALAAAAAASATVTGIGWIVGVQIGGDQGSPADVAAEPGSGTITVGDHVAIVGDWIFDNAHDGWHELHPVKKVLKLVCPEWKVAGVDIEEPHSERSRTAIEENCLRLLGENARRICELLRQGELPDVRGRQREPQHDPVIHPRLG